MKSNKKQNDIDKNLERAEILYNNPDNNKVYYGKVSKNDFYNNANNKVLNALKNAQAIGLSGKNYHMSQASTYVDTPYAHENTIYDNYHQVEEPYRERVRDKITKQIGENKLERTKGIYANSNNHYAKNIAKTGVIKDFIKNNQSKLDNGEVVNGSVEFPFWKNPDFKSSISKADILDMKKDENGDINFKLMDTYDFNGNENFPPIKWGRKNQQAGNLIPYFQLYDINIPNKKKER